MTTPTTRTDQGGGPVWDTRAAGARAAWFPPPAPAIAPTAAAGPSGSPGRSDWPAPPPNPSPAWARWALAGLLAATAALYLWGLSRNGWANSFYSAAAQAAGTSWKAWFFGSFDAANAITVDKPPAALWLMGLSVRLFGLSSWSVLAPQALLGVASVGVLYATIRRWFGAPAGLVAGAILAVTPVATLMFRYNNPDALLVFLLVCAAWAMGRATERGTLRWIMLAGALVGFAFLAKMLQAFLVLPGFVAMYAVAAPIDWRRRLGHLAAAFFAMIVAAGWWVAVVQLWPADSRPYIGGSQSNSMLELIFGYNGFGRLTGNETGSVGGSRSAGWGTVGWSRLFTSSYGGQIAWLLPGALAMIAVLLWVSRRGRRTDLVRAATIGWGGWLLVTAAVISFSQGIIHEYYTVALAPAIGALIGAGGAALWAHRWQLWARVTAATLLAGTAWWASTLLARSSGFVPWLGPVLLLGGLLVAIAILAVPLLPRVVHRIAALAAGLAALALVLAGPAAYSVETATTSATGSLPTAGPPVSGGRGGFGGGPGAMRRGPGAGTGGGQAQGAGNSTRQRPTAPGGGQGASQGQGQGAGQGQGPSATRQAPNAAGGAGSLLRGSEPSQALAALLLEDADAYTWVAAAVGSNAASGYQLATERPVMAIGGFNGTDPSPTLAQFQQYVAEGRIHYFLGGDLGGQQNGGSEAASQIVAWVLEHFTASSVDGVSLYDLTAPSS